MGEKAQLILREMKMDDAKDAAVICKKCFGKNGAPRRKFLEDAACSWRHRFFVAELDGKIVACMGASLAKWYEDYYEAEKERAEIEVVAVDPDYHGQGIGTKLFTKLIAELDDAGVKEILLRVHPSNAPAIEFYEHFSFKCYGDLKSYYERGVMLPMVRLKWKLPSEQ